MEYITVGIFCQRSFWTSQLKTIGWFKLFTNIYVSLGMNPVQTRDEKLDLKSATK
jgi:hypothetical protein